MSASGLPGDEAEAPRGRNAVRRALVYFGLAEDVPANRLSPRHAASGSQAASESAVLAEILRKLDEQTVAIAELGEEVARLRERER